MLEPLLQLGGTNQSAGTTAHSVQLAGLGVVFS